MPHMRSSNLRHAVLLAISTALVPLSCGAQAASAGSGPPGPSRIELYGGYAYFHPMNSDIYGVDYQPINEGGIASATGYITSRLGIQAEGSLFPSGPNDCVYSAQAGAVYRFPMGRLAPFVHLLGGEANVGGPTGQPCTWGWGATGGAGLDYILPQTSLHNHLAIRLIQSDFAYSHVDYGPRTGTALNGGVGDVTAYRLSAGVVFRFGEVTPPEPAVYGCVLQPASIYAGDPIHVSGSVLNLDKGKHLTPIFTWSTTGGKIEGSTENATVSTGGLAPGEYVVTGRVREGKQPTQHTECKALFRVLVCVANSSLTPAMSCR
jgi:hypothetical protein